MSDRIDTTQYECAYNSDLYYQIRMWMRGDNEPDEIAIGIMSLYSDPIAELKRCYKRIDLLKKAFMMAGDLGCYMTMCEECDDVHTLDDECPFICEYCHEKDCGCSASE